ncbi:hypothetical protein [Burkholderia sp. BE12]|uniref:hypothetical protein n=1 Tax=Burkholderia sp. BE12 TaxID=2082394 RepID=UPI000CF578CA|nr:hypothetical protein [Burkholderia sp. BE12]
MKRAGRHRTQTRRRETGPGSAIAYDDGRPRTTVPGTGSPTIAWCGPDDVISRHPVDPARPHGVLTRIGTLTLARLHRRGDRPVRPLGGSCKDGHHAAPHDSCGRRPESEPVRREFAEKGAARREAGDYDV